MSNSRLFFLVLFSIALLTSIAVSSLEPAEAKRSQGVANPVTLSKQVCGDRLCESGEELTTEEKIGYYLLNFIEVPESTLTQQSAMMMGLGGMPGGGSFGSGPGDSMMNRGFANSLGVPTLSSTNIGSQSTAQAEPGNFADANAPLARATPQVRSAPGGLAVDTPDRGTIGSATIGSFGTRDVGSVASLQVRSAGVDKLAGMIEKTGVVQGKIDRAQLKIGKDLGSDFDRKKVMALKLALDEQDKFKVKPRLQLDKGPIGLKVLEKGISLRPSDVTIQCIKAPCVVPDSSTEDTTESIPESEPEPEPIIPSVTIIDDFEIGAGGGAEIIQVSENVFAIAHHTSPTEVMIQTIDIESSGIINDIIDSYGLGEDSYYRPSIIHVVDDVYAIAYEAYGSYSKVSTISIDSSGNIGIITDTEDVSNYPAHSVNLFQVSDNYLVVQYNHYQFPAGMLSVKPILINSVGTITPNSGRSMGAGGQDVNMMHVSDDIFAMIYRDDSDRGNDQLGMIKTYHLGTSANIPGPGFSIDRQEFAGRAISLDATHVANDIYAIAYAGGGAGRGYVTTVSINSTGMITPDVDTKEFTEWDEIIYNPIILELGEEKFAVIYSPMSYDGEWDSFIMTLSIDESGNISSISSLTIVQQNASPMDMIHLSGNVFAMVYSDHEAGTFKIMTLEIA